MTALIHSSALALIITFLTTISCTNAPAFAQTIKRDSVHQEQSWIVQDFQTAWRDAGIIFSAPARFSQKDWIQTGVFFAETIVIMTLDEKIRTFTAQQHSPGNDVMADFGNIYGTGIPSLAFAGGLYFGGLACSDKKTRDVGLMIAEATAFSGIITTVLKSLIGRSRPYNERGQYDFTGYAGTDNDRLSLPSGHATVAFSLSSVLAGQTESIWLKGLCYGAAGITAFARIYRDQHWASDVVAGGIIGTVIGNAVVNLHQNTTHFSDIHIIPTVSSNGYALNFRTKL